jgi:crotonobetainyl-CoA:carnitine CoA-transferase CaiB-like acyl-CoA transferase
VIGLEALADDPLYRTNKDRLARRDELVGKLSAATHRMKRDELLDKLEAVQVPAGPINTLAQVFADPQVKHRGMRLTLESGAAAAGTIPGVRTPIVIDGLPMASPRPSPRLGEHSAEILKEIDES